MSSAMRCVVVASIVMLVASSMAMADPLPGRDFIKFAQLPMITTQIPDAAGNVNDYYGHDELSTAWIDPEGEGEVIYKGRFMADDFADPYDRPVVHVKWWGSYMGDQAGRVVDKFAIVFENDIPKDVAIDNPDDPYTFSHPDCIGPKYSQISKRDGDGILQPMEGTFTERLVPGSNPNEPVYEYNAELCCPFDQEANKVYWLKIVALVDEPLDDQNRLQWGWHNRDYTIQDPFASTLVNPGENIQGVLNAGTSLETPIWHFQDDAVSGDVENIAILDPCDIHMDQDHWGNSLADEHYVDGIDGPDGIGVYSKDLAFVLYSVPEPSTIVLLVMGVIGMALTRRR